MYINNWGTDSGLLSLLILKVIPWRWRNWVLLIIVCITPLGRCTLVSSVTDVGQEGLCCSCRLNGCCWLGWGQGAIYYTRTLWWWNTSNAKFGRTSYWSSYIKLCSWHFAFLRYPLHKSSSTLGTLHMLFSGKPCEPRTLTLTMPALGKLELAQTQTCCLSLLKIPFVFFKLCCLRSSAFCSHVFLSSTKDMGKILDLDQLDCHTVYLGEFIFQQRRLNRCGCFLHFVHCARIHC